MRKVALCQIILLLGATFVPTDKVRLVSGSSCGDNCQCTAGDREAGFCCCNSDPSKTPRFAQVCCQRADTGRKASCCVDSETVQTTTAISACPACSQAADSSSQSCCNTPNCVDADHKPPTDETPPWGAVSRCPCGDTVTYVAVQLPRVLPLRVRVSSILTSTQRLSLLSDRCLTEPLQPPLRPPKWLSGPKIA